MGPEIVKATSDLDNDLPSRNMPSKFPTTEQIPANARLLRQIETMPALIGGNLVSFDGPHQKVISPIRILDNGIATQVCIGQYPMMNQGQAMSVLDSAVKAYDHGLGTWPTMSSEQRIAAVENFLDRMIEKREEVVRLLMWEIGKTRPDAEKEFDRTVSYVRESIDDLKKLEREGEVLNERDGIISRTGRAPRGVVLCMGPFNYPLNETFTTLMPALLTGNTVVFKPPKIGVLLFEPLIEAFQQSFPPGVVNTAYGDGREVISPIIGSGKINVLAFIGSTQVADAIEHQNPRSHRTKAILGLGAKNPAIIMPDADIDGSLNEIVSGALSYNGQRCTALKLLFVHESKADEFVEKFSRAVSELKIGMPWEPGVKITPLPEENKTKYMSDYVEDAVALGARVINANGGKSEESIYVPAVLYPVKQGMKIYSEEQFGPVVPIVTYKDPEEVVRWIAQSEFHQQASVFGKDPEQISAIADRLARVTCRVNINAQCQRGPDNIAFTGGPGSAMGTLSVRDALLEFSIESIQAGKANDHTRKIVSGGNDLAPDPVVYGE